MEPPQGLLLVNFQFDTFSHYWFYLLLISCLFMVFLSIIASAAQKIMVDISEDEKQVLSVMLKKVDFQMEENGFMISLSIMKITVRVLFVAFFAVLFDLLFSFDSVFWNALVQLGALVLIFWKIDFLAQVIADKSKKALFRIGRPFYLFFYRFPFYLGIRKLVGNRMEFVNQRHSKATVKVATGELAKALELTIEEDFSVEEHKIFEGIVKFGNTEARQIMRSRVDMVSISKNATFDVVMLLIQEHGYSRVPVYENRQDNVCGVLNIKDLLPHLNEDVNFDWQKLIREPYFIPETKKIDDLLSDFQQMKNHIAIVVDEYGGTSGIVTLEDVLEEILGDISDEFDDEDVIYSKIDEKTYVFEGRTSLSDFYRITGVDEKKFEAMKGDAETIGGFIVEANGKILKNNEWMNVEGVKLIVEASDKRRVKLVKVEL